MLNQTGIHKSQGIAPNQILINPQYQFSVGAVISKDCASSAVTENGRKILKAGTPLTGDLDVRTKAFTLGTATDVVGLLLHDVDITETDANGTVLLMGCVNINRVHEKPKALLTKELREALKHIITIAA